MTCHHHHHNDYPWFLLWAASRDDRPLQTDPAYRRFVTIFVIWPMMAVWAGFVGLAIVAAGFIAFCVLQALLGF